MKDITFYIVIIILSVLNLVGSLFVLSKIEELKDRINSLDLTMEQFRKFDFERDMIVFTNRLRKGIEEQIPDHYISENGTKGRLYKK